ncbi:PLP-dependent cysteine synthase family protein [Hyperthermus butylicus]|uniref:Cysteine synthase n=1 Tax=Hyperthermus butylicus (strain DSM 5456 / JCM 9403 / PLM1-5) TaxID=415426 RepID=A2BJ27_HYPBU|nr:cysteine synthase family protein [Hyperthermus butylicus]ABM79988.1 Cysteine synthase [Hyperthermus butylicus DSM 5456]
MVLASKPSSREELLQAIERLSRIVGGTPTKCFTLGSYRFCVKLEYVNPAGSHKDRIALYMIKGAIESGAVDPGGCVAEVSSGNTATSVAWIAHLLGLRSVLFVEKTASAVKKKLIRMFGGEIVEVTTEGSGRERAREEIAQMGCFFLDQMANEMNHLAHYETTASELLSQVKHVDAFVMGVGTAGTVTGVGRRLKETLGNTLNVAVTPKGSALAGGRGEDHIEGLVSDFVPDIYSRYSRYVDRVVEVSSSEAIIGIAALLRATGLLAGPSTGAAFVAATRLVECGALDRGSTIVIVAADHLSRYPDIIAKIKPHSPQVDELLKAWQ